MIDNSLFRALVRLAAIQREGVDRLALTEAAEAAQALSEKPKEQLAQVCRHMGIAPPGWIHTPDGSHLPAIIHDGAREWGVLVGRDPQQRWVVQFWQGEQQCWREEFYQEFGMMVVATLRLAAPFSVKGSPVFTIVSNEILNQRRILLEAAVGGAAIGLIGLVVSFYSMQVYDRVIPTGGLQTLMVLTLGSLFAIGIEWLARGARTHLYEGLINVVDQRLARTVYLRLLSVRLDQLPRSVGSMAAQMRGYETVRSFLTQATGSMLVDLPFAIIFLAVIGIVGGPLAGIPLLFLLMALAASRLMRNPIEASAKIGAQAGNFKTGLLVETIEGAETIKSGQGGWRMLSRWLKLTSDARNAEFESRRSSEAFQHMMNVFQQVSYILLVASGAWMASRNQLTMGRLIACSILAGRVLNPVSTLAAQTMQWAHVKAALEGIDGIWRLEDDHHGHEPVVLEQLAGNYRFANVRMAYGSQVALQVPTLEIRHGERIGIVGPVGAGKTSLLRLLSGMYKPSDGQIFLDDVDLAHLSKPVLAHHVGYLQQEGRLFAGTLRENLTLGMIDPGDDQILQVARSTGLMQAVIATHPKGLQQEIYEGGSGLSGGQRQLVNFTRVCLRHPTIWLLDEPTASVDTALEQQIINLLGQHLTPDATLVLVTHKPDLLKLVTRLIVVANHQIVMDGPTEQVMARLQGAN